MNRCLISNPVMFFRDNIWDFKTRPFLFVLALLFSFCSASISSAAPDPQEYTVTLRSPSGTQILDLTLLAGNGIHLGPKAGVTTADGSPALLASLGSGGVTLEMDALAGHIYSASVVSLRPFSHLLGGIDSPSVKLASNSVVDGVINKSPTLTPLEEITFLVKFPTTSMGDVTIQPSETRELVPARYRNINVAPGAKLQLKSGTYYAEKFILLPGADLEVRQQNGPTYVISRKLDRLSANLFFTPANHGFLVLQTGSAPIDVDTPFQGVIVAPWAKLNLNNPGEPHRGMFIAQSIVLNPKTSVIYGDPNPLISLLYPPGKDLQECALSVRPRRDLTGLDREQAYQADIARYCSMVGSDECAIDYASRANVDFYYAAGKAMAREFSPAQYLSLVYDRTRKLNLSKSNPQQWCAWRGMKDSDGDWIPDAFDKCPGTPDLTATDDNGCPDGKLPPAPSADEFEKAIDSTFFLFNPNCNNAPGMPPPLPGGAFFWPCCPDRGAFILVSRITNQPPDCPVWYLLEIQELSGQTPGYIYSVAFMDLDHNPDLVNLGRPVPPSFIQFNPHSTDPGTTGRLGNTAPPKHIRYRVKAINGNGAKSPWSEWKISVRQSCLALGFDCQEW
jgi:hypothetical protein